MEEEKHEQQQVISEQPDKLDGSAASGRADVSGKRLWVLALTALGIVYGDIGTSPLYAFRFAFYGQGHISPTSENVLGVLSLIFWSLTIVISIKYIIYVMEADNGGEGGILALMALLVPAANRNKRSFIVSLGVFGAALLYGDGMITPAISVLSAVEGLEIATQFFRPYIIIITIVILMLLFLLQQRGTRGVGSIFGPVMLLWFIIIGLLGINWIIRKPLVLTAINPLHALNFFIQNGWSGFLVLGAVFLVVTGGEALYADMGHFGRRPIRRAWFSLVFPALLLNYFGQGALLMSNAPQNIHPFYSMAPQWAIYPLVLLATAATIIASQAVVSGAFSLTRQAALLDEFPRIKIIQTSKSEIGQIYIPLVNWILMIATIGLVVTFRKSDNLGSAYGVAVTTTMVITTLLAYVMAREKWKWNRPLAILVSTAFLTIDLSFFTANMIKVEQGGWFPLVIGALVFLIMSTWRKGREILGQRLEEAEKSLKDFLEEIGQAQPVRVPGTAIFMTGRQQGTPPILLHHLQHNKALHEQIILLTVVIEDVPYVWNSERIEIKQMDQGFVRVIINFGFMEDPDVPSILRHASQDHLDIPLTDVTYYIGRQTIIPTKERLGMALWRERLFAFMARNAAQSTTFFHLPQEDVVEHGIRIKI